jgi:hypothetical protein
MIPELLSGAIECVVYQQNCFPRIIGQSRSEAVNGGIITSDQSIKTCASCFHRGLSFLIPFLQLAVQHIAAPAGGFHLFTSFYGNGGTRFQNYLNRVSGTPIGDARLQQNWI